MTTLPAPSVGRALDISLNGVPFTQFRIRDPRAAAVILYDPLAQPTDRGQSPFALV